MDLRTPLNMKQSDWLVAGLLALIALAVGGYALWVLLPIMITLAANTIIFAGELVVLAVLAIVLLDKNTWLTVLYKWKNISRSMRKAVVRENPIGVLDTVIERFSAKLKEIQKNVVSAIAARKRQDNAIADCMKKQDAENNLAIAAKRQSRPEGEIERHAVAGDRWGKAAADMQPMAVMLRDMEVKMQQAQSLCESKLVDMQNQREVLSVKLDNMKQGQAAVRTFRRFFGTNPDLAMMQMSVEEIERQSTEAESEIDEFMRAMTPAIEDANLAKQAEAAQAMSKFDKFLTGGDPSLALPVKAGELVGVKEQK